MAERFHGKKFVAARFAAQRGKPEDSTEKCGHAGNVVGGDALQFQVAANSAVRIQKCTERHQARVKSRRTSFAAPWQYSRNAEEVVHQRPAAGTPGIRTMTERTA